MLTLLNVQGRVGTIGRGHTVWYERCAFSFYCLRSRTRARILIDARQKKTSNKYKEIQAKGLIKDVQTLFCYYRIAKKAKGLANSSKFVLRIDVAFYKTFHLYSQIIS